MSGSSRILVGDCRTRLAEMEAESVQMCVTSPPYFGLRDYGVAGQIGLESTPDAFVAEMVAVFREVRRVLRGDGTLWLNLGDSYTGSGKGGNPDPSASKQGTNKGSQTVGCLYETGKTAREAAVTNVTRHTFDIGPKQLLGIPWRVALALQADGWYLRSDIIWHKPNPMPESVVDRPTKAHEYLFLLSKSPRYYYDAEAIREPLAPASVVRLSQPGLEEQIGSDRAHAGGKSNGRMKAVPPRRSGNTARKPGSARGCPEGTGSNVCGSVPWEDDGSGRNRRSVWTVPTKPFSGAHFATFPPKLIEPCILAGSRHGDMVLDPFGGAGTTGMVATQLGRHSTLIELNPEYAVMAEQRIAHAASLIEPSLFDGALPPSGEAAD